MSIISSMKEADTEVGEVSDGLGQDADSQLALVDQLLADETLDPAERISSARKVIASHREDAAWDGVIPEMID